MLLLYNTLNVTFNVKQKRKKLECFLFSTWLNLNTSGSSHSFRNRRRRIVCYDVNCEQEIS